MAEDWQAGGFGIYIHWPFCTAKCPYCDFNSHVSREVDQDRWCRALLSDLRRMAALVGRRSVGSVFFGGGTPSLMPGATVAALLAEVERLFVVGDDLEVTLEANPTSVEAGRFRQYRDAGVNRFSLGVQSLVDADLKALGRLHTVSEALAALDVALETGARVSIDLMYGRQHQKVEDWRHELERAMATGVRHISLYQLTIEPMTAFGTLYERGRLRGLPDNGLSADFFALTQEVCTAAGLARYEISNHAIPGEECRHNLVYWRYGDYLGIGPGAHGRLTVGDRRLATRTALQPDRWLELAESGSAPEDFLEELSGEDQALEYVLMGLRTREGLSLNRLDGLGAGVLSAAGLKSLVADGLVESSGGRLVLTESGVPFLNRIIEELV